MFAKQQFHPTWITKIVARIVVVVIVFTVLPFPPAFAAQVTADSLAGYWKLDETSGTSTVDSSGGGNTGTHQNTPTISSNVPSVSYTNARSLSFDRASSEYVTAGAVRTEGNAAFTYSVWINTTDSTNDYRTILSEGRSSNDAPTFHLQMPSDGDTDCTTDDSFKVFFRDNAATSTQMCSSLAYNDGAWHHIALVQYASNSREMFVDGTSVATNTATISTTTFDQVGIGALRLTTPSQYFNGNIDDVRIYSRALSRPEISELAAGNHTTAYWKGKAGSAFERQLSWSGSFVPDPYSRLIIRYATGSLTLTGAIKFAALTINTGAVLSLNGTGVTMNDAGTFTNYGTLALKNTETLTSLTVSTNKGLVMLMGTGSTTGLKTGNSYYDLAINDGLVGYLKFDETSGTRAVDASGYSNSGTLISGPTISTTVAPTNFLNTRSLDFDGTDDYVKIFDHSSLRIARQISFSAWIKPDSFEESNPYLKGIISKYNNPSANGPLLRLGDGTSGNRALAVFTVLKSGVEYQAASRTTLIAGQWYHIAGTYDGAKVRIFVNGIQENSTSLTGLIDTSTDYFAIGNDYVSDGATSNREFDGIIDDVRIYNRALSPGDIAGLAAGNQPSTAQGYVTQNAALDVNNNLSLNGGTLDVSASNYGITVGGSWLGNGGVFTSRQGTVTLDGTSSALQILSGGQRFNALTTNGAGATWTLADRLTATGTLSLTAGTLDVSTGNYAVRAGTVTQTSGSFTPRSGILVLTSPNSATATITTTLNTLQIEDPTEYGLVGYWKFDEGTNTGTILDSSGRNFTGVRHGTGAVWTGATLPNFAFDNAFAMQFNRKSDYVDLSGKIVSADLSNGFYTLSAWVYARSLVTWGTIFKNWADAVGTEGFVHFGLENATGVLSAYLAQSNGTTVGPAKMSSALPTGEWVHVVAVANGTNVYVYQNGVVGSTSVTYNGTLSVKTPTAIGAKLNDAATGISSGTHGAWNGFIDDVRIYNRALSAAEVRNLYSGYYADGDNSTSTFSLGSNLATRTLTILSGVLGGSTRALSLTGDWNNYSGTGGFVKGSSSVDLVGSSTQNVRGSTNFYNFEISTSAAQTVNFGSGTTQGISNAITLTGQNGALLTLSPITAAYEWFLNVDSTATQSVSYVTPSYSDAGSGAVIIANGGTNTNGSNNTNWQFTNPAVHFSLSSLTLSETSGSASLVIHLTGSSLLNVTVPYSVSGTATGTGTDFTLFTPSPIVFNAAETNSGIIVLFVNDSTIESNETIVLTLGTPTNASLGATGSSLTLTLTSDEIAAAASSSSTAVTSGSSGGGSHRGAAGPGGDSSAIKVQQARLILMQRFNLQMYHASAIAQEMQAPAPVGHEQSGRAPVIVMDEVKKGLQKIGQRRGRLVALVNAKEILYHDVVVTEWYAPYVASLIETNIAQGYRDAQGNLSGEFGVANPVTKAEVLKMALEGARKKLESKPPRNLSARNTWAAPYVGEAERMGLTTFPVDADVNIPATRGEVMQIMLEVMGLPVGKTPTGFLDVPSHHPFNKAISTAAFYGIAEGDTDASGNALNTFRPDDEINRAEVSKIIVLLQEILK